MKKVEEAAKSVEAAIESGLAKLGVTRDRVDIEVVSEGGVFSKARVILTTKPTAGEKAVEFVERVLKFYRLGAIVDLKEEEKEAVLDIVGTDVNPLVCDNGEIIDSLQYLASLVANKDTESYCRIIVDSEDYRSQREEKLRQFALDTAKRAVEQGRRMRLKPMNSHERRIVHSALHESVDVTTHSEGFEPNRYLVIVPKNLKDDSEEKPRRGARSGNRQKFGTREGGYNRDNGYGSRSNSGEGFGGSSRESGYNRGGYGSRSNSGESSGSGPREGGYNRGGYGSRSNSGESSGSGTREGGYNRDGYGSRSNSGENAGSGTREGGYNRDGGYGSRSNSGEGAGSSSREGGYNRGGKYGNRSGGPGGNRDRRPSGSGFSGTQKKTSGFSDAVFLGKSKE